jgi:hypothetical protein
MIRREDERRSGSRRWLRVVEPRRKLNRNLFEPPEAACRLGELILVQLGGATSRR